MEGTLGLDKPTTNAPNDHLCLPFRDDRGTLELEVHRLRGSQEVQTDGDEVDQHNHMPVVRW